MGSAIPKQYLPLCGKPVIAHTLERIVQIEDLSGLLLVLHPDDQQFAEFFNAEAGAVKVPEIVRGGDERCQSVLNAVLSLKTRAQPDDWVLVHDAARPCVRAIDIDALIQALWSHPVGGLLARPVYDTLKQVNSNHEVLTTVDRSKYWQALTPQMFRFDILMRALLAAVAGGDKITDDAAAVEALGLKPLVVPGSTDNIKITNESDLGLAERIIEQQTSTAGACP
jgi:2-C-methyl-D-erythritol 4-phosphate cytidylyltransferase